MQRSGLASVLLMALSVGLARAAMVTERWGASGRVQHARALTYQLAASGGRLMAFDLSALPKPTKIYRARLVFFRERGSYDRAFEILPAEGEELLPRRDTTANERSWRSVTRASRPAHPSRSPG